ncbi:hypothetical protein JCM16303_000717 [Sporobolomyces ruberrimus]
MSRSTASKRPSTASTSSRSGSITSHEYRPSPLDAILAEQGLHRYRLEPPSWRAPWDGNLSDENGNGFGEGKGKGKAWPVFYPTRDGMDEDQMTESAADTFSAHGHILDNLKAKGMLENLSRIVTAVQQKRETNLPTYGPSTFRLPSRITLTDSKRESWFSDLANPAVPLSKLSRSVPHGYKGEKGLDMLSARKVEISRAVWFVRAFGGVEIQSLAKSRPLPTAISQYTSEFTTVVCEFIRKQLLGLCLPGTEAPAAVVPNHSRTRTTSAGLNSSTAGPSVSSDFKDPEARAAWKEKFDYTLALVNSLLSACLLSTPQFIRFLVSIIDPSSTTLAQLSVALLLIEEYWDQVEQAMLSSSSPLYNTLETTLSDLVRSAFLALPDAFSSLFPVPIFPSTSLATSPVPLLPAQISDKLESVLLESKTSSITADDVDQDPAVLAMIRADLSDLAHRRLEATRGTCAANAPSDSLASSTSLSMGDAETRERAQLDLITRLDNFSFPQSIASLHSQIFLPSTTQTPSILATSTSPNPSIVSPSLQTSTATSTTEQARTRSRSRGPILPLWDALPILFTWATTPCRLPGPHRRYTVANLVSAELERERQADEKDRGRQGARTRSKVSMTKGAQGVAEAFIGWVDETFGGESQKKAESESGTGKANKHVGCRLQVRGLAEELMRVGALGHGFYMQKMIARGETERTSSSNREGSIHLWILGTAAVEGHATGGMQATQTSSTEFNTIESQLNSIQAELTRMIPGWSGGAGSTAEDASTAEFDTRSLLEAVSHLTKRGKRLVITREIISNGLSNVWSSETQLAKLSVESFALLVSIFELAHDFPGLLHLFVLLLRHDPSPTLLVEIADLAAARIDLWAALGGMSELAEALVSVLATSSGSSRRRLLACLRPLAVAGYLKGPENETVLSASQPLLTIAAPLVSSTTQASTPSPLVELQVLATDSTPATIAQLANTLCSRYIGSTNESWLGLVIDSSVQILAQLSGIEPIVGLFKEIDERLGKGLEPALIRWMRSKPPQNLVPILGGAQGSQLVALLSELVVEGVLSLPVLVSDGFLPIWRSILVLVLSDLAKHTAENGTSPLPLEPTLSRTLSILTDALARAVDVPSSDGSNAHPYPAPLSSSAILTQQRKSVRLGCLFTPVSLPTVSSLLALLVLQQEVLSAANLTDDAQAASALFLRIVSLQQFQALVVKVPQSVRVGMLESDFVKSLPSFERFKPKLLAGLLVALKDGGEATPANLVSTEDWDLFLSGLTIWRLAVSKVEVEACLERLDIDSTLSNENRSEAVHTLSNHFLERVCAGQGQTYLGEQVVKCYHGAASDELVSVAFDRLASAIKILSSDGEMAPSAQESASTAARCTIRLLETLLQSGVASARNTSIRQLLQAVNEALGRTNDADGSSKEPLDIVPLLVNIVNVAIRCTDGPTDKATADIYAECLSSCATLAVSFAGVKSDAATTSALLLDTCSQLLLALPDLAPSTRLPSVHSFIHSELPNGESTSPLPDPSLPDATFVRLTHLFGAYLPPSSVQNPWELLDHSESSPAISGTGTSSLSSSLVNRVPPTTTTTVPGYRSALTNGGPIDLAAFRAKVVESIPAVTALDALSTASSSSTSSARPASLASNGDLRGKQTNFDFETSCTGLSVHARDHRRTSSAARSLASKLDQAAAGGLSVAGNTVAGRKRNATDDSAPSKPSASSAGAAGGGGTASKAQDGAGSTAAPTTRGTKRKASNSTAEVIVIDDEDDEVVPPAAKAPKKGKTATKTVVPKGRKKK